MILSKKFFILIIAVDILVMGLVFSVSGFLNANVDTNDYITQIEHFIHPNDPVAENLQFREFKPLYGFLGQFLAPSVGPAVTILLFNISFFVGLSLLFYCVLRLLDFDDVESFVGVLWLIFGYPLLKYGLSLGTDMSGWFFSCLSIASGLAGVKKNRLSFLVVSSLSAVLGMLSKETGVLGLGFVGLYVLFQIGNYPWKKIVMYVLSLSIPFLICYGIRSWYLSTQHVAGFLEWYTGLVRDIQGYHTPLYLLGVESSAFNILLIYSIIGIYFAITMRSLLSRRFLSVFVPLFIVSLPMLLWPIFIGRILYIQFLFFIPLALYGVRHLLQKIKPAHRQTYAFIIMLLPVLVSSMLFIFAKNQSLFDVVKSFI